MKTIKKILVLFAIMFAFALPGCGTTDAFIPNWNYLHRVGPDAKMKVYRYDKTTESWILTKDKVSVPEGHYISPPPTEPDE